MKRFFIAGTDTGVGKTLVAAAFAAVLRSRGLKVAVMKPISCGGLEDARLLKRCAECPEPMARINPIALKHPLSPNVAATIERKKIDLKKIDQAVAFFSKKYDALVIEGCGGLLVPVVPGFFVVDLVRRMRAECILVSRSGLGAINHSLLSLEALSQRGIRPLGIVLNRLAGGPLSIPERTNPEVIARFGRVPVLGVFPFLKNCGRVHCLGRAFVKHIDLKKLL